jgi:hypothetical protein
MGEEVAAAEEMEAAEAEWPEEVENKKEIDWITLIFLEFFKIMCKFFTFFNMVLIPFS